MNIFPSSIIDIGGFFGLADHERNIKQHSEPMTDLEKAFVVFEMLLIPLSLGQNVTWKDIAWELATSAIDYDAIITAFTAKGAYESLVDFDPSLIAIRERNYQFDLTSSRMKHNVTQFTITTFYQGCTPDDEAHRALIGLVDSACTTNKLYEKEYTDLKNTYVEDFNKNFHDFLEKIVEWPAFQKYSKENWPVNKANDAYVEYSTKLAMEYNTISAELRTAIANGNVDQHELESKATFKIMEIAQNLKVEYDKAIKALHEDFCAQWEGSQKKAELRNDPILSESYNIIADKVFEQIQEVQKRPPVGVPLHECDGAIIPNTPETYSSVLAMKIGGGDIQTTAAKNGVYFDHNGDGMQEKSAWIDNGNAFLAMDRNGDGDIDGTELFGSGMILPGNIKAANAIEALKWFDSNKDFRIDSSDGIWSGLRIWQDKNRDGKVDSGELRTLDAAGIEAISFRQPVQKMGERDENGNRPGQVAVIHYKDDNEAATTAEEIWLDTDHSKPKQLNPVEVDDEILALPDIEAHGDLPSLHQAMALDVSGLLAQLVESYGKEANFDKRKKIAAAIVYRWVDVVTHDIEFSLTTDEVFKKKFAAGKFLGVAQNEWYDHKVFLWMNRSGNFSKELWTSEVTSSFNSVVNYIASSLDKQTHFADMYQLAWLAAKTGTGPVPVMNTTSLEGLLEKKFKTGQKEDVFNFLDGLLYSGYEWATELLSQMVNTHRERIGEENIKHDGEDFYHALVSNYYGDVKGALSWNGRDGANISTGEDSRTIKNIAGAGDFRGNLTEIWAKQGVNSALLGTGGIDHIYGSQGNDLLYGGNGQDTLLGGGGADEAYGGDGNDAIVGMSGDDLIFGGNGDDVLLGDTRSTLEGLDNELAVFVTGYDGEDSLPPGNDRIYGGAGNDIIDGCGGNDFLDGGSGDDVVIGGEGDDIIIGGTGNDHLRGDDGNDTIYGGEGNDNIEGGAGIDRIYGGSGNDYIWGNGDKDSIFGGDGIDYIDGGDGDDEIFGEDGNDNLFGGSGKDTIFGGKGNDSISGGDDSDFIYGGVGADLLMGDSGDDYLQGDEGDDKIYGGSGKDYLYGGVDDDWLEGGTGSDTYEWGLGDGNDTISETPGGGDVNTVKFTGELTPEDLEFVHNADALRIRIKSSGETLTILKNGILLTENPLIHRMIWPDGTEWGVNEILYRCLGFDVGPNTVLGGVGDDVLRGGSGDDILDGRGGYDIFIFGRGDGHDTMVVSTPDAGKTNILRLSGLNPGDIELLARLKGDDGSDLVVRIRDTGETFTLRSAISASNGTCAIAGIEFADGTLWDWNHIVNQPLAITEDSLKSLCLVDGPWTFANPAGYSIVQTSNRTFVNAEYYCNGNVNRGDLLLFGTKRDDMLYGSNAPSEPTVERDKDGRARYTLHSIYDSYGNNDILYGGAGNDYLEGGRGDDVYLFGKGDGHDVVNAFDQNENKRDIVRLYNLNPEDVEFGIRFGELLFVTQNVNQSLWDLIVRVKSTGETLTICSCICAGDTDVSGKGNPFSIQEIMFANGVSWDWAKLISQPMALDSGEDGATRVPFINGGKIVGNTNDNIFSGSDESDTFIINAGGGKDRIVTSVGQMRADGSVGPTGGYGSDKLYFGDDISFLDLRFSTGSLATDLVIDILGTQDRVTVEMWVNAPRDINRLDSLVIGGFTLDRKGIGILTQVMASLGQPMGADGRWSEAQRETLARAWRSEALSTTTSMALTGDDVFRGDSANDVYFFGRGDGHDVIDENDTRTTREERLAKMNVIRLKDGVGVDDIELSTITRGMTSFDLVVTIKDTRETLTVLHGISTYFSNVDNAHSIQVIEFSDGTKWSAADILARLRMEDGKALVTDYTVQGNDYDDTLTGGDGSDSIYGEGGNDVIQGGKGDDKLYGGKGEDTYLFNRGDGQDIVYNYYKYVQNGVTYTSGGGHDTLVFGEGIRPEDLWFATETVNPGAPDAYANLIVGVVGTDDKVTIFKGLTFNYRVDCVKAAGMELDFCHISVTDFINAMLSIGRPAGADGQWTDQQRGALDAVLAGYWMEPIPEAKTIYGSDEGGYLSGDRNHDAIIGGGGNDIVRGKKGDDGLYGGLGDDIYIFNKGDGRDTIFDDGGMDRLVLGGGIAVSDLYIYRQEYDDYLYISVAGTDDFINIENGLYHDEYGSDYRIEKIQVGNQVLSSSVFEQYLQEMKAVGAPSGPNGTWSAGQKTKLNTINNKYWKADTGTTQGSRIGTEGDDILVGGSGGEVLLGMGGNDILDGRGGNDALVGDEGNDVFVFGRGYGHDTVDAYDAGKNKRDIIRLTGLGRNDVELLNNNGRDFVIRIKDTGETITVRDGFLGIAHGIQAVEFGDGSVVEWNTLRMDTVMGMTDADMIYGTSGNDRLYGSDRNDVIFGGAGDDIIFGWGGKNIISGGKGDDLIVTKSGSEFEPVANGHVPSVNTILFERGDGHDTLRQAGGTRDTLVLGDGIGLLNLQFRRSSTDPQSLVIAIVGTHDSITVENWFSYADTYESRYGVGSLPLAISVDGAVIDARDLSSLCDAVEKMGMPNGSYGEWSVMQKVKLASLWRQFVPGVTIDTTGLLLPNKPNINTQNTYSYKYGTSNAETLLGGSTNDVIYGYGGNDTLKGNAGNDLLWGGTGNDVLEGGAGNDIFAFGRGDGHDTVNANDSSGKKRDVVQLYNLIDDDVELQIKAVSAAYAHLIIRIKDTGETLTIQNAIKADISLNGNPYSIQAIEFGDGTIWEWADIVKHPMTMTNDSLATVPFCGEGGVIIGNNQNNTFNGSFGNDTIYGGSGSDTVKGGSGNDTLWGGTGNDRLEGGAGDDTYLFNVGDGNDTIVDIAGNDKLLFGDGLDADDLWFSKSGYNLIINAGGSANQVTINNWFNGTSYRVESIQAGGMELVGTQMDQLLQALASFGAPQGADGSWTDQQKEALAPVIASYWKPVGA